MVHKETSGFAIEFPRTKYVHSQFFLPIFYIFQKLGTSLRAQARSQINIQMRKVADVKPAEGLRDIVFPFVWFSDGIETIDDATTVSLLHSAVHTPEKARSAL